MTEIVFVSVRYGPEFDTMFGYLVRSYLVQYVVRSYLVRSVVRDFGTKFRYDIIWFGTWYDIFGTKLSGSVRVRTFGS